MSTFLDIEAGLIKAVKTMPTGLRVQYEGIAFDTLNAAYLRMRIIPNRTEIATLGIGGCNLNTGILQIDVYYPNNAGTSAIVAKADEVYAYFYENRTFSLNTLNIRIERTSIEQKINSTGWIQIPITIEYSAQSVRTN